MIVVLSEGRTTSDWRMTTPTLDSRLFNLNLFSLVSVKSDWRERESVRLQGAHREHTGQSSVGENKNCVLEKRSDKVISFY